MFMNANKFESLLESTLHESFAGAKSKLVWKKVANKLIHDNGGGETMEIADAGGDYLLFHVLNGKMEQIGFKKSKSPEAMMQHKMQATRWMSNNDILAWNEEVEPEGGKVLAHRTGKGTDLVITLSRTDAVLQVIDSKGKRDTIDSESNNPAGIAKLKALAQKEGKKRNII